MCIRDSCVPCDDEQNRRDGGVRHSFGDRGNDGIIGCLLYTSILLLIIVGEAARRAVTARNAASAGGNHKNGVCRDKGDAFCIKNAHRDFITGHDFECSRVHARKCRIRNVKTLVVVVQLQPVQLCAILECIRAKVCKRGQNARFQVRATLSLIHILTLNNHINITLGETSYYDFPGSPQSVRGFVLNGNARAGYYEHYYL